MTAALTPLLLAGAIGFSLLSLFSLSSDWGGMMTYLLAALPVPFLAYAFLVRRGDPEFPLPLLLLAYYAKLSAAALRYWSIFTLYDGGGDAARYHQYGRYFARSLQEGDYSVLGAFKPGSAGLDVITGVVYSALGESVVGIFVLFSTLAFLGSVFFYMTYLLTSAGGNRRLYRLLVFFLPSILFWPASLGKDSLVFFGLGLASYGLAKLWKGEVIRGPALVVSGIAAVSAVRPYTAGVFMLGIGTAYVLTSIRQNLKSPLLHATGGFFILAVGALVLQNSREFLLQSGVKEFSWEGLKEFYMRRRASTRVGGAAFVPPLVLTLLGPAFAVVTMLFRPFPWEAHNAQSLLASLECFLWTFLIWRNRRVILGKLKLITKDPWVAFIVSFTVIMMLIQTTTGNFAIIARQRVQFLPLFLMLLA
jgi:hypothetical protein